MMRKSLWMLLVLLVVAGTLLLRDFRSQLSAPSRLTLPEVLEIAPGAGLYTVIERLRALDFLQGRQAMYLAVHARLSGLSSQIKAGEYEITPGMSPLDALQLFVSGRALLHPVRIGEAASFREVISQVQASAVLAHTLSDTSATAVMTAIGRPGQHPEGRFFPDTYHFARRTRDVDFLRRAAAAMDRVLAEEWAQRDPDLPYTGPEEALVMASIVEKETGVAAERAQVAGVFVNRLRRGIRLQTDPAVIYGLGEQFDGNLRRRDLLTDTPYNTYTRAGLPPTPICMPGRAAIHAALHPAPTKALFFVARGDGSHVFSETLEEHNAAVRRYQLKSAAPEPAPLPKKPAGKSKKTRRNEAKK